MVTVDVEELDADAKENITEFMESKLPVKCEKDGDLIRFEEKSPRSHVTSPEIRTYLKRYLHVKKLKKQYRLLSEGTSLKFVKQKIEKEEEE